MKNYLIILLSLVFVSCTNSVQEHTNNELGNNSKIEEIKKDKIELRLKSDKETIVFGDSIELNLEVKLNDSIIFADFIYSVDDSSKSINWRDEWGKPTTKYSTWLSGGPGKHFVKGQVTIPLKDSSINENWTFEYLVTEK